jgi:hypothetical protein
VYIRRTSDIKYIARIEGGGKLLTILPSKLRVRYSFTYTYTPFPGHRDANIGEISLTTSGYETYCLILAPTTAAGSDPSLPLFTSELGIENSVRLKSTKCRCR